MRSKLWRLLLAAVVAVVVLMMMTRSSLYRLCGRVVYSVHSSQWMSWCTREDSKLYLEEVCQAFLAGEITGSFCKPLCVEKEIHYTKCFGTGVVKAHVLEVQWSTKSLILKSEKSLPTKKAGRIIGKKRNEVSISQAEFVKQAEQLLYFSKLGKHVDLTLWMLGQLFSECDLKSDGMLRTFNEALTCWSLVYSFEYVLFLLLNETTTMPQVYGVCGRTFAVEYTPVEFPLGVGSMLSEHNKWKYRSRLALALLDMIEALENTPYGPLHLCDVKEDNFGSSVSQGKLVAKAIDVNGARFEGGLVAKAGSYKEFVIRNKTCTTDDDCSRLQCRSKCNITTGKCSAKLKYNNLQRLCDRIFTQRDSLHTPLLHDPPASIREEVEMVLSQCANAPEGQTRIPMELLARLRSLLLTSIQ